MASVSTHPQPDPETREVLSPSDAPVAGSTGQSDTRRVAVDVATCVEQLYNVILKRPSDPVGHATFSLMLATGHSPAAIARDLIESVEYGPRATERALREPLSVLHHYNSVFDLRHILASHAVHGLQPHPEYIVNFLGVLVDPVYYPALLAGKQGTVEPVPNPSNWHADIAEWAAALRAVDIARESFTMIELGCGWGCWLNNTGVAARRRSLEVHLIGVEGDAGHIGFARRSTKANGFSKDQVELFHGVAAATSGVALFPRQAQSGRNWGLEPVFGASEAEQQAAIEAASHDVVKMIDLQDLIGTQPRIDLLHVDIQGGEADLVEAALPLLGARVAYLVIGTHSRTIEGRLFDVLLSEGWTLEVERPALLDLRSGTPRLTIDGVQGWRNPRLAP